MLHVALSSSTGQDAGNTAHPSEGLAVPIHPLVTHLSPPVPCTSRHSAGGPVQPMLGNMGCTLCSLPRVSQPEVHRELHKGLKNHRKSSKCRAHGWVYFCGCHSTGTLGTSQDTAPACTALFTGDAALCAHCYMDEKQSGDSRALHRAPGNNCSHMPAQVKTISPLPL